MSVKIKLFLDDDRHSTERRRLAEGYDVWVDRAQDAIAYLSKGNVSHISLDHDLGDQDLVGKSRSGVKEVGSKGARKGARTDPGWDGTEEKNRTFPKG